MTPEDELTLAIQNLSEEDRTLIVKAMLLGCAFSYGGVVTGRWYGSPSNEPPDEFSYYLDSKIGMHGSADPVELARHYVDYKRIPVAQ